MKRILAGALTVALSTPSAYTQQVEAITPVKPATPILRWYETPSVPGVQLGNSNRLASLIRGGKLYLTAQDAVALALENNLDVEIARYNPILDQWNLERAEAGGALPGVPSGSSQVGTVARGQGVSGSQAAAGVIGGQRWRQFQRNGKRDDRADRPRDARARSRFAEQYGLFSRFLAAA